MRQIALPFPDDDFYPAEEFLAGSGNAEALACIGAPKDWPNLRLAVWGDEGCGKTHLLHVFAQRYGAALLAAQDLRRVPVLPAALAIAVDDADAVADPRALLHLLNLAAEERRPVLLAARTPPSRWGFTLPDLTSRLRAITAVHIAAPDDALLAALLRRLTVARQLSLDAGLHAWLLARLPRQGSALREAVARLDRASLAAHCSISRKLAALVLAGMIDSSGDDAAPPSHTPPFLL